MKVNEFNLVELILLCEKVMNTYEEKLGDVPPDEINLELYKHKGELHVFVSRKEKSDV